MNPASTSFDVDILGMAYIILQVTSTYEGLHQGRILCATASSENLLLTGGDSTVGINASRHCVCT